MSLQWGNQEIDGEIEVANMYKNAMAVQIDERKARTGTKRVSWIANSKIPKSSTSEFMAKSSNR